MLHFADRIEFISSGRLPNTVTIEKLKNGASYAVNSVIVKFIKNQRYIDKLGCGIPMVVNEIKKMGLSRRLLKLVQSFVMFYLSDIIAPPLFTTCAAYERKYYEKMLAA